MSENTIPTVTGRSESIGNTYLDVSSNSCDKTKCFCWQFKKSVLFKNLRYPIILMRLSCIYIPAICVCETKENARCRPEIESDAIWRTEKKHSKRRVKQLHEKQEKVTCKHPCPNSHGACLTLFKKLACALMVVLHSVTILLYIFVEETTSSETGSFMYTLTCLVVAENYLFLLISNSYACARHFTPFISAVFKYNNKYNRKSPQRTNVVIFWLLLAFQICQVCVTIYFTVFFSDDPETQLWPFSGFSVQHSFIIKVLGLTGGLFTGSCVVFGPVLFQGAIIGILKAEFTLLGEELHIILANRNNSDREIAFNDFVKKFKKASELTNMGSNLVKHTTASLYICNIPLAGTVMYALISVCLRPDQYIVMSLILFEATLFLLSATWIMAALKSQAHELCDIIYAANWCKFSPQLLQKITVFTTMFQAKPLGMSVYDMFTIDWSTLLAVIGGFLAYGLVVAESQFRSPRQGCLSENGTLYY